MSNGGNNDTENMNKLSRGGVETPSNDQFRTKYHDEVMTNSMRVRQSINSSYYNNLNNFSSQIVPGYKREEVPAGLNVPMLSGVQRTTSSFSNSNLSSWNSPMNTPMNSFDERTSKRGRDDDDE